MRIYVAGALFSEAERAWLDGLVARLREEGFDCFVPHEQFSELKELTPAEVFRVDATSAPLFAANASLSSRRCTWSASAYASPSSCRIFVDPSTSVKRNVTTPVGSVAETQP